MEIFYCKERWWKYDSDVLAGSCGSFCCDRDYDDGSYYDMVCGGALVGAVMAAVSLPLWSQIIAFAVISVILLILTRPWALKYVNSRTIKTNVDSLIGQTGLVTQDIDNLNAKGQVKVRGQIWTARSISDEVKLHEGQKVSIESISGVKVIVKPM